MHGVFDNSILSRSILPRDCCLMQFFVVVVLHYYGGTFITEYSFLSLEFLKHSNAP